jgi:Phytanoyl-CoA dioxygenase (PhyH)
VSIFCRGRPIKDQQLTEVESVEITMPAALRGKYDRWMMNLRRSSWLLAPVHAAALLSAAKSFRDNPILGNSALNQAGLHVRRVRLAAAMAAFRRRRLQHLLSQKDLADFHRDGFVLKQDYLPAASFRALQDEVVALAAPAREMIQGDAVTRRIALDAHTLAWRPAVRAFVEDPYWLAVIRYAASSALTPLTYIQTIFSRVRPGGIDPQTFLHADTFHSTVKAWFFLTDVAADAGPFVYVPGSHRLTSERLDWERRMSLVARRSDNNETQEGSFRITEDELAALHLPAPRPFAVPANTLIVADTMGFHARGPSTRPSTRIEIWAYGRRNPFLPCLGWDPVRFPGIAGRAARFGWAVADLGERLGLGRNPWRSAGRLTPDARPSLHLFA